MKKIISKVTVFLLMVMFLVTPFNVGARNVEEKGNGKCMSKAAIELKRNMKTLWMDHIVWTRSFIVSDIGNLGDKEDVLNRLLKNQEDIGNLFKPYYGEEAGKKITDLLKEHIVIAGKIVDAVKASDSKNVEAYNKEWYKNADDIVNYINSLNPALKKEDLKELFYTHLKLVTDQVVSRANKEWKKEIEAYDKGRDHMMHLASALSNGIITQFKDKFK